MSVYTKHSTKPVRQFDAVPVHLFVGKENHKIEVARSRLFESLTLVSRVGCSKRPSELQAYRPRSIARSLVARHAPALQTEYFFDTRPIEPNNISHLLMEIIPLCLSIKQEVDGVTFVFRQLQPRFRELLEHFGIEPLCTARPVRGKQLTFWLSRGLSQYQITDGYDVPLYTYTGDVYSNVPVAKNLGSKLFISRRGIRAPINEKELNDFLINRGFKIVFLEDLSIKNQIETVQEADTIVAIHGAGIAFLALKDNTSTFIEIMPPSVYHDHFPVCLGGKVGTFVQIIPQFEEDVQFQGWPAIFASKQKPFEVDIDQLAKAIDLADNLKRQAEAV